MAKPPAVPSSQSIEDQAEEEEAGRAGRPPHQRTEANAKLIEQMSGAGVTHEVMCTKIGISKNTLKKHYAPELMGGKANVHVAIGQTLVRLAIGAPAQFDGNGNLLRAEVLPDVRVLIFLGKTRLGLKETNVSEFVDRTEDAEFGTAGLTESERIERVTALLERAGARRDRRAVNGSGRRLGAPAGTANGSLRKRS